MSPNQEAIVRAVIEGRDLLCAGPAGEGTRLAHELASQYLPRPTLVVSARPLELRAQHDALLMRRVPAVRIDPSVRGAERHDALQRLSEGGPLVVHVTPEVLREPEIAAMMARVGLSRVVIEDAHCFAPPAHELRVAYAALPRLLASFGAPPLTADSGPARAAVRAALVRGFGLRAALEIVGTPVRANVTVEAVRVEGQARYPLLLGLLARLRRPGLVLCATDHEASALHAELRAARVPVHRFHGGMSAGERGAELLNFSLPGRRTVMIATSAFGPAASGLLGLDASRATDLAPTSLGLGFGKRDIRFVIHYNLPASLEQYTREVDLAGRDGEAARCVLMHDPADRPILAAQLAHGRPPASGLAAVAECLAGDPASGAIRVEPPVVSPAVLARAVRLSEASVGTLLAMLEDAGLVAWTPEGARRIVSRRTLGATARELASRLSELGEADACRLEAVDAYARASRCRTELLNEYFGTEPAGACACGVCTGDAELIARAPAAATAHASRRRAPATELRVDRAEQEQSHAAEPPSATSAGSAGEPARGSSAVRPG